MPSPEEMAYALLWRFPTADKRVTDARILLLDVIGKEGQQRGIEWVHKTHGPMTDAEVMRL